MSTKNPDKSNYYAWIKEKISLYYLLNFKNKEVVMKDATDKTIYCTTDHNKFSLLKYNRKIDQNNVYNKKKAILRKNQLETNPIKVTKNMEVIDGQHRLQAAKELGLPIYYMIVDDFEPEDLVEMHTIQSGWKIDDYLLNQVNRGNENYIKFQQIMFQYDFSVRILLLWVSKKSRVGDKCTGVYARFKGGEYVFDVDSDLHEKLCMVSRMIEVIRNNSFKIGRIYHDANFHNALKNLSNNKCFDREEMIKKFEQYFHLFHFCATTADFIECLLKIYNHKRHTERLIATIDPKTGRTVVSYAEDL